MVSVYEIVELAKKTGKIEKGTNEATKAVERGTAKLIVVAEDVQPKEIIQHLPGLCQEKGISCEMADSKQKLGASAGISVPTAAVAIIETGDALKYMKDLGKKPKAKPEKKEEKKEEKPAKKEK